MWHSVVHVGYGYKTATHPCAQTRANHKHTQIPFPLKPGRDQPSSAAPCMGREDPSTTTLHKPREGHKEDSGKLRRIPAPLSLFLGRETTGRTRGRRKKAKRDGGRERKRASESEGRGVQERKRKALVTGVAAVAIHLLFRICIWLNG